MSTPLKCDLYTLKKLSNWNFIYYVSPNSFYVESNFLYLINKKELLNNLSQLTNFERICLFSFGKFIYSGKKRKLEFRILLLGWISPFEQKLKWKREIVLN